jgi:hypothetical protein
MNRRTRAIFIIFVLIIGIVILLFKRELFPLGAKLIPIQSVRDVDYFFKGNMTISPDNNWIVYIGDTDQTLSASYYNLVAFDLIKNKKYILNKKGKFSTLNNTQMTFALRRNCWSSDSNYCYLQNGTNTAIDFTKETPILIDKSFDSGKLTCSDCPQFNEEKEFSQRQHGYVSYSPDHNYKIISVVYGNGFYTDPYIYLIKNGIRRFITKEVESLNWSSDSKSVYFLKREGSYNLYKINFD